MGRSRNRKRQRRLERQEASPETEEAPEKGSIQVFDLKDYEDAIDEAARSGLAPEHVHQLRLSVEYLRNTSPEQHAAAGVVFLDSNRSKSASPEEASS